MESLPKIKTVSFTRKKAHKLSFLLSEIILKTLPSVNHKKLLIKHTTGTNEKP